MLKNKIIGIIAAYVLSLGISYSADSSINEAVLIESDINPLKVEINSIPSVMDYPIITFKNTFNPDDIFEDQLKLADLRKKVFVLDVHGTLTNEEKPGPITTLRGQAVNNVKALIQKGATVIFCSAWDDIVEVRGQLIEIGFEESDFLIDGALPIKSNTKIEFGDSNKFLIYNQYGRILSVKHDRDSWKEIYGTCTERLLKGFLNSPYYFAKGFAPYILANREPDFDEVHFLDDSARNRLIFQKDVQFSGLYSSVYIYGIKSIDQIKSEAEKQI